MIKEKHGSGRLVVTGIRWEESTRRASRSMFEVCQSDKTKYLLVKDIKVGKKRQTEYREAKLPYSGPRKNFTALIQEYLTLLEPKQRLFPWSLEQVKNQ